MNINDFLLHVNDQKPVLADTELYEFMCQLSLEARKITDLLNNSFLTPEEIQDIFSDLTGKPAD